VDEFVNPQVTSPLAQILQLQGPISLRERSGLGKINLRGAGAAFFKSVEEVLQQPLPTEPNTTTQSGDRLAFWLGPDEWLVHLPIARVEPHTAALRTALAGQHTAIVDVSDQSSVLRLAGKHSQTVLAKGCPLDLHPRAFQPGSCAQSFHLKAAILIFQVDETPTYDIQVRRSFVEYLSQALIEGAQEFQLSALTHA
jgi:sarcosine oxidase subunit gamma